MTPDITLVYFSCQGREHLLRETAAASERYHSFPFRDKILAFDGPLENGFSAAPLGVNKLVNNVTRAGYVPSVRNALSLITTPYFFWQEDDCRFLRDSKVEYLLTQMEANPNWSQLGWGLGEKFPAEEKVYPLGRDDMYQTAYGFSARPALCRTSDMLEAFAVREFDVIDTNQDIEEYVREWLKLASKLSVSIDPGDAAIYVHEGALESVEKGLLKIKPSKLKDPHTYRSGLGHKRLPSLLRRFKNLYNFSGSACRLSWDQFHDVSRYDVAWRVVNIERTTRR